MIEKFTKYIGCARLNETAFGGKDSTRVDGMWTDKNTGNAWASFASGGNEGGPEIDVRPVE